MICDVCKTEVKFIHYDHTLHWMHFMSLIIPCVTIRSGHIITILTRKNAPGSGGSLKLARLWMEK